MTDRPVYAVICELHGNVCLSTAEYERQLNRPDVGWTCPYCGREARWDDDCLATSEGD